MGRLLEYVGPRVRQQQPEQRQQQKVWPIECADEDERKEQREERDRQTLAQRRGDWRKFGWESQFSVGKGACGQRNNPNSSELIKLFIDIK